MGNTTSVWTPPQGFSHQPWHSDSYWEVEVEKEGGSKVPSSGLKFGGPGGPETSSLRVCSRARSSLGSLRVHSRARSSPGSLRVHSRARSILGSLWVHSLARSSPGTFRVHSRACSSPGFFGVHSRARSSPEAHIWSGGQSYTPTLFRRTSWNFLMIRVRTSV